MRPKRPDEPAAGAPEGGARLRLGVDFHTFEGIYQGTRSHLLGLYRQAIRQAPDMDFIFLLARPDKLKAAGEEFSLPNVELVKMAHAPGPWRILWQLAAMQRRHRLDLLHLQFRLPLFTSGRCCCTVHDVLFETHPQYFGRIFRHIARWSARDAVRRACLTLTVSEYSRREIAQRYHINPQRVVLTPNAVDRRRFHPRTPGSAAVESAALLQRWGLSSDGYLCTLGRLEPRKNHVHLVRAYARLPANTPPLVIVGQRDFAYQGVLTLIRQFKLEARVRLLDDVDDEQLPVLLRHARLMAYPSQAEGFGMPVLEALASGIPVITSTGTSLPEVAGGAAWLVDPANVDALTAALRACLDEPAPARQARVERGLAHCARFDWAVSASALLSAVRKVTTL